MSHHKDLYSKPAKHTWGVAAKIDCSQMAPLSDARREQLEALRQKWRKDDERIAQIIADWETIKAEALASRREALYGKAKQKLSADIS